MIYSVPLCSYTRSAESFHDNRAIGSASRKLLGTQSGRSLAHTLGSRIGYANLNFIVCLFVCCLTRRRDIERQQPPRIERRKNDRQSQCWYHVITILFWYRLALSERKKHFAVERRPTMMMMVMMIVFILLVQFSWWERCSHANANICRFVFCWKHRLSCDDWRPTIHNCNGAVTELHTRHLSPSLPLAHSMRFRRISLHIRVKRVNEIIINQNILELNSEWKSESELCIWFALHNRFHHIFFSSFQFESLVVCCRCYCVQPHRKKERTRLL